MKSTAGLKRDSFQLTFRLVDFWNEFAFVAHTTCELKAVINRILFETTILFHSLKCARSQLIGLNKGIDTICAIENTICFGFLFVLRSSWLVIRVSVSNSKSIQSSKIVSFWLIFRSLIWWWRMIWIERLIVVSAS